MQFTGKDLQSPIVVDSPIEYESMELRSRNQLAYQVLPMSNGSCLAIPLIVLVGCSHRPRLTCIAGIHGNEHEGVTALIELSKELSPKDFDGTLVMVPVANPPAFRAGSRQNPNDQVDLNRVFPGRLDGNTTEVLAYHLFHDIALGADLVLSMHGLRCGALGVPYAEYPKDSPMTRESRDAAYAFGLEYVEALEWPHGLMAAACNRAGIPAIEPEIGGLGCTIPERRALYKLGMHNLMRHLGMENGDPVVPKSVIEVKRSTLYAPSGGIIRRQVELGDEVRSGDCIAIINDLTGNPLARIEAPVEGFVGWQRLSASVNPGDWIAVIFEPQPF